MGDGDTFRNAIIGALITVFGAWLPFSPVFGGAAAAYLQNRDRSVAIKVGALSGVFALVPFMFILFIFGSAIPFLPGMGVASGFFLVVFVMALISSVVYTVGLGAVGGYVGWYLRAEDVL